MTFTHDQVRDSVAIVFDRWRPTVTGDIAIVRRIPIESVDFSLLPSEKDLDDGENTDTIKPSVANI